MCLGRSRSTGDVVGFIVAVMSMVMIFLSGLTGCTSNGPSSPSQVEPDSGMALLPLALGNFWVYRTATYFDSLLIYEGSDSSRINFVAEWGGQEWFGDSTELVFLRNAPGGVRMLQFNPDYSQGRELDWLHYPADVGETWQVDTLTFNVVSTTAQVSVPAGDYRDCYIYRAVNEAGDVTLMMYVKPGLGEVRSEVAYVRSGLPWRAVMELTGFDITPP